MTHATVNERRNMDEIKTSKKNGMKIKVTFPQIVFQSKEIEVTQEQADSLILDNHNVPDFVWENMTEQEQTWTEGKKWVSGAINEGWAGVKAI